MNAAETAAAAVHTAASHSTLALSAGGTAWAVVFGIVIVGVLILAFWWGARRRARDRAMPAGSRQRGADSWHEPQRSETHHSARSHGDDEQGG
jgi:uncharacterized protein DUF6479